MRIMPGSFERFDSAIKPISWVGIIQGLNIWKHNSKTYQLDSKPSRSFKKLIMELKEQGCSILVSTYIIDTIKEVWDMILIMNKGKIVSNIPEGGRG